MSVEWAGRSPELLVRLDRARPLRVQLESALREAIRSGRLSPGERLPSSRAMAARLGVSRGLVQEAFDQLKAEGYLTARTGSATRVAAPAAPPAAPAARPEPPAPPLLADFRTGVPDLASFPRADWAWAQREAARTARTADLGYGDPRGARELREVLAGYLRRVRGAAADPGDLVICGGFAQGLILALRAAGVRRVAFEDPGYDAELLEAAAWLGVEAVPVPVDEEGIDVEALLASGADAAVLTPAHQWPTGVVLSPARRRALAATDLLLVEDDYDAEFRYDRDPVGVLQGLAADRVLLMGTVSKSLAPAVRLGWILCPPAMTGAVARQKAIVDRGSPHLDQLALAALLHSGRYDRHLRRMRTLYAARRAALVAALALHAPQVRLSGLAAGFHAVAHLPAHLSEEAVIAAARDRGVALYGLSTHHSNSTATPPLLVLGFGNLPEHLIHEAIALIAPLLR
ncbi:GntR family transcriptional regulator/MocR family aminotransferase [Actinocorallia herbida]|uniref:GntR family transcriptional regulator/MocR family aminotransferase n=1 Tax=Actinocorallia herbida TaxID=58109 RepID=A0A3N1CNS6_9ACTN|nr:PLP-dependent aminotransferase family protein [Actinocorallia herbida]ROO82961.1 GntR family transcriptional regulator/MocR family aminotransferase [Actinocorallia herbida]